MSNRQDVRGGVTIAALLNLIRLMGAELVAGEHRDDVNLLIRAVEAKLGTVRLPDEITATEREEGLLLARQLLEPILTDLRKKSVEAHLLDRLSSGPGSSVN